MPAGNKMFHSAKYPSLPAIRAEVRPGMFTAVPVYSPHKFVYGLNSCPETACAGGMLFQRSKITKQLPAAAVYKRI